MHISDYPQRSFRPAKPGLVKSVSTALLISFFLGSQALAFPFGKNNADESDSALNAVQKIKLSKEQQSEFDTSLKNGNAYLRTNNSELAQICFMRCTTLNPTNAESRLGLACCYIGLRKLQEAEMEVFEALRCDPVNVDARFMMGQVMMADQRWDEAGGQYLQVLKQQPENLGARGNLATCLQMMGQVDAAIGQYKYILEKAPKAAQAAFNLAAAYEMKGLFEDAAVYYKKVVELDPQHTNAYCSLAKCLIAKKDLKSAQVLLTHAAKIAPGNHFVHLMQGFLNEVQSNKRGAIEEYTRAVALAPRDPDSQKALQRMLETGAASRLGTRGSPGRVAGLNLNTQ